MGETVIERAKEPMGTRCRRQRFGRIGLAVLRPAVKHDAEIDVVADNDVTDADSLADLHMVDSVYGRFAHPVRTESGALVVAGRRIQVLATTPRGTRCPCARSLPPRTGHVARR